MTMNGKTSLSRNLIPFLLVLLLTGCSLDQPLLNQETIQQTQSIIEPVSAEAPAEEIMGSGGCPVDFDGFLESRSSQPRISYASLAVLLNNTANSSSISPVPPTNTVVMQQSDSPDFVVTDGSFVWGPGYQDFDITGFLEARDSSLAAYADQLELWASYTTINPTLLLAFLEMQYGYVSALPDDISGEEVVFTIGTIAMDLSEAFYEHLYTWGTRRNRTVRAAPALQTTDGVGIQLNSDVSSGTFAVLAAAARHNTYRDWTASIGSASEEETDAAVEPFLQVYGSMFPQGDLADDSNDINPPAAPPVDLFQLAYPLGATWYVSGAHSWAGGSTPPFSSLDFFLQGGISCDTPPDHYIVAAAYGDAVRPYDYSCWIQMDHGDGWETSYYHLMNTYSGGTMGQNGSIGTISCEICAGGYATGPHVHFSVKYNGSYISLEGVTLSGWIVHPGDEAYYSGTLERDGVILDAYSQVFNDYDLYFEREELSLRFYGNGTSGIDRVKIRLDIPPRPADIGDEDFTIEWWMKALPEENVSTSCTTGADAWVEGNILFDRRMQDTIDNGTYGISIMDGAVAFGVNNGTTGATLCGSMPVLDDEWHHVAVTRTTAGDMAIYVDGVLDTSGPGPAGDISYADGRSAVHYDDTFLIIGAERFDTDPETYPSYSGWLDELRLSNTIRYTTAFSIPEEPFNTDADTVGLYHFNEGERNTNWDTAGSEHGPSNGSRKVGGDPEGPAWSTLSPFRTIFDDVPADHWAVEYIEALYDAGYVSGCSSDPILYCPDGNMTRGEGAVFVERGIHGGGYLPEQPTATDFDDVDLEIWYAKWAQALYDDGYTAGCGTDPLIFCPEDGHTRAEGAVFYLRMLNGPSYMPTQPTETVFADVDLEEWYAKWVEEAYAQGIYLPCQTEPELLACPGDPLLRDVAAYMMVQAKGGLPLPGP